MSLLNLVTLSREKSILEGIGEDKPAIFSELFSTVSIIIHYEK